MANEKNRSTLRRARQRKSTYRDAAGDLSGQIAALQQLMARLEQMADHETTFAELVDFMEKYSRSSTRLATLLRAQRDLAEEQGVGAALSQALDNVLSEIEAARKRA